MSRQINPNIFGDYGAPFGAQDPMMETLPLLDSISAGPTPTEVLTLLEKARFQTEEWIKSVNLRLEKMAQRLHVMEERIAKIGCEAKEHLAHANTKFKERQMSDLKIEALVERHNQIVQNFEMRLNQAQKVIENQALQLAKQQEVIDESRRQIEKLKRV